MNTRMCCDVLLTVHLGIFISLFNQLDAQNLFHNKFYFMPLHASSTCANHQEVKIALHRLWYHHTYRCDDTNQYSTNLMQKNCFTISFISCLYMFRAPCAHHQEVKIASHNLWYHHTYRCDDTRVCVTQF